MNRKTAFVWRAMWPREDIFYTYLYLFVNMSDIAVPIYNLVSQFICFTARSDVITLININ